MNASVFLGCVIFLNENDKLVLFVLSFYWPGITAASGYQWNLFRGDFVGFLRLEGVSRKMSRIIKV